MRKWIIKIKKEKYRGKKFKSFEYSKKEYGWNWNFVDFTIYEFKILKNLNILNIVKYSL